MTTEWTLTTHRVLREVCEELRARNEPHVKEVSLRSDHNRGTKSFSRMVIVIDPTLIKGITPDLAWKEQKYRLVFTCEAKSRRIVSKATYRHGPFKPSRGQRLLDDIFYDHDKLSNEVVRQRADSFVQAAEDDVAERYSTA